MNTRRNSSQHEDRAAADVETGAAAQVRQQDRIQGIASRVVQGRPLPARKLAIPDPAPHRTGGDPLKQAQHQPTPAAKMSPLQCFAFWDWSAWLSVVGVT
jgi:hypothetical protein